MYAVVSFNRESNEPICSGLFQTFRSSVASFKRLIVGHRRWRVSAMSVAIFVLGRYCIVLSFQDGIHEI